MFSITFDEVVSSEVMRKRKMALQDARIEQDLLMERCVRRKRATSEGLRTMTFTDQVFSWPVGPVVLGFLLRLLAQWAAAELFLRAYPRLREWGGAGKG
jgi:hypothetical protein